MTTEYTNYSLIMAGGSGTRFWPESTAAKPKQYLTLAGDKSLLRNTLLRLEGLSKIEHQFVITISRQKDLALECSQGLVHATEGIILEPAAKNTAPCILLALAKLVHLGAATSDIVAIMPADHIILNQTAFLKDIKTASALAFKNKAIVTIGIPPHFPHTGFGYIQRGEEVSNNSFKIADFKEKPDSETAQKYLATGEYYWNAGMFVSPIQTLLTEFAQHAPELFVYYEQLLANLQKDLSCDEIYQQMQSISIDYAIMEKSDQTMVLPASFDWNDLGSWDALESVYAATDENTLLKGNAHYFENACGNIISVNAKKFISLVDVQDLVIVENEENIMILPKTSAQKVKNIVNHLKSEQ